MGGEQMARSALQSCVDRRCSLVVAYRLYIVHRLLGPVVPSFRALPGRLKFTVRRHKFNEDSLSGADGPASSSSLLLSSLELSDTKVYEP